MGDTAAALVNLNDTPHPVVVVDKNGNANGLIAAPLTNFNDLPKVITMVDKSGNAVVPTHVSSLNVLDYGIVPTNTAAQNNAGFVTLLAAIPASGATIVFVPGDYNISATISYTLLVNQHIIIEGSGARLISTVPEPGAENGILKFVADNGSTAKLTIHNLVISHTNSGLGLLNGIHVIPGTGLLSLANIVLDNVRISGTSARGTRLYGVQSGLILNCSMSGNRDAGLFLNGCVDIKVIGGDYSTNVTGALSGDYGISLASSATYPPSTNILISGVQANNNGRKGIDVHHGHHIHIVGNDCIGNGYSGIYAVAEDTTKDVGDIIIENNYIDQTGGNVTLAQLGIELGSYGTPTVIAPGSFIVKGNEVRNVDIGLTNSSAIYIHCPTSGPTTEQLIISGNTVKRGAGSAGAIIWAAAGIAIPQVVIEGNTIHAVSCTNEIYVQNATYVICAGNQTLVDGGTPTNGINIVAAANAIIANNQLNGAAPTTSIASSSTQMLRDNQLNGVIINNTNFTVDQFGHLLALQVGIPTLTAVNANVANAVVTGNDVRGTIVFDVITGTLVSATALFTVTFANAYGIAPSPVVCNASNQTANGFYVTSSIAGSFTVRNAASLIVAASYRINYIAIG